MWKSNEKLNNDLKLILEKLPEGILILDKITKRVITKNN